MAQLSQHQLILSHMKCGLAGGPQYSEEASLYAMMELAWHLCEVLYIEVLPAGCLIQQLLEWVRWHGSRHHTHLQSVQV